MTSPLLIAATFLSRQEPAEQPFHIGPGVMTLLCAGGCLWACFTAMYFLKGIWFVRRELQPWRAAIPFIIKAALCLGVAIAILVYYNLAVAKGPGTF